MSEYLWHMEMIEIHEIIIILEILEILLRAHSF